MAAISLSHKSQGIDCNPPITDHIYTILGGGVNRFSDRRISQKKLSGFRIKANVLHGFRILLIQKIADLSNILARIADFASNLGESADLYTPIHPPPPPILCSCTESVLKFYIIELGLSTSTSMCMHYIFIFCNGNYISSYVLNGLDLFEMK